MAADVPQRAARAGLTRDRRGSGATAARPAGRTNDEASDDRADRVFDRWPDAGRRPDRLRAPVAAVLIGDVVVGPGCYVGPCASLRGDFGRIEIRAGANIQDSCILHSFPSVDTVVEEEGHIGHGAILHGCRVPAQRAGRHERRGQRQRGRRRIGDRRGDGVRQGGHGGAAAVAGGGRPGEDRARADRRRAGVEGRGNADATRNSRAGACATMHAARPLAAEEPGRSASSCPSCCRCRRSRRARADRHRAAPGPQVLARGPPLSRDG